LLCYSKRGMSCLFRSLSFFVNGMDETALRQKICDFLATNPTSLVEGLSFQDITAFEASDPGTYIQKMRHNATWGGGIEIKAFCEIFRVAVEIRVHASGDTILFVPEDVSIPPSKIRIEWTGNHYEPMPYS